jgi:hypothetical protein
MGRVGLGWGGRGTTMKPSAKIAVTNPSNITKHHIPFIFFT